MRLLLTFWVCMLPCALWSQLKTPIHLNDGWTTDHMLNVGMDTTLFHRFFEVFEAEDHKVQSILLVKEGKLVLERYYNGQGINDHHTIRSVSKSVVSLLAGIALDQGLFSLDDLVSARLTELSTAKNQSESKQSIQLRHLLNMNTGLECNDWDKKSKGQEDRVYKKKNWLQVLADLPMVRQPGDSSLYCSGGVLMLAAIIERTSGLTLQEYAQKYLFDPLDIEDPEWNHTNKGEVITAGKRLYLKARDMAHLGQLVLNKGQWNGQQVVPQAWIETIGQPETTITGLNYSHLWWHLPFQKDGLGVKSICATGNGGQYILVFPEYELVAVFTGKAYNSPDQRLPFSIVNRLILPSIKP